MKQINITQFEVGDVLQFQKTYGMYKPNQVIVLKPCKGSTENFTIVGHENPNSFGDNNWLENMLLTGDIVYLGNIGANF